ncbi:MAG: PepSY domain-containing protein [Pseudomonadales bacterium]|jgi:uncharacterized iron-regulated membrane protein|nr:PepSY domain-containing protein [Pseudomonadales bacterium]
MNGWQRWLKAPATSGFRRFLFQVHLWLGIGFGLYVLMISITGSAIVLRTQIGTWLIQSQVENTDLPELTGAALEARISEVYTADAYTLRSFTPSTRPGRATYVVLERNGKEYTHYFDQYQGKDLGSTFPWQTQVIEWLVDLHDELLMGREGRRVNGWGGVLFMLMLVSGLLLWWQGSRRWHEGLLIRRDSPRSFMWQLHNFLGFWSLPLMLAWGLTAIYFAWPAPFDWVMDFADPDLNDFERPDGWLRLLIDLHFGRFRGLLWANILWVFLGLIPAVLIISGVVVWYRRVIRRRSV